MNFFGDYNELRGFLSETGSGDAPALVETEMETIFEGETASFRFTIRDDEGVQMSTADVSYFQVSLVYQNEDGTYGDTLGTWTYDDGTYSEGMSEYEDGVFQVDVAAEQTGTSGILAAVFTITYVDPEETKRTATQDVLEILDLPTIEIDEDDGDESSGDTYLSPTGDSYFQPDGESYYLQP